MRNSCTKLSIAGFVTCCVPEIHFQVVAQGQSIWCQPATIVKICDAEELPGLFFCGKYHHICCWVCSGQWWEVSWLSSCLMHRCWHRPRASNQKGPSTLGNCRRISICGHKWPRSKFPHRFGKLMALFRRWPWEPLAHLAPQALHVQVPCIQLTKRWTEIGRMWLKDDWHDIFLYYKTIQNIEDDNLI